MTCVLLPGGGQPGGAGLRGLVAALAGRSPPVRALLVPGPALGRGEGALLAVQDHLRRVEAEEAEAVEGRTSDGRGRRLALAVEGVERADPGTVEDLIGWLGDRAATGPAGPVTLLLGLATSPAVLPQLLSARALSR